MQYKTIVLELLEQHPKIHERLRRTRSLLSTLNSLAEELKADHEAWKETLMALEPDNGSTRIASEAMEMALKELEDRLLCESVQDVTEPLSLDQAMAHFRKPSSNA